jgi:hypothetical protein
MLLVRSDDDGPEGGRGRRKSRRIVREVRVEVITNGRGL